MTTTPKRNNEAPKSIKLFEIARLVRGELSGNKDLVITGVAGIQEAQEGDISFIANSKYLPFLRQTKASAVLVTPDQAESSERAMIRVANPSAAFTQIVSLFIPEEDKPTPGVHPTAVVSPEAVLSRNVSVGPHAVIGDNCHLDEDVVVSAGCVLSRGCRVGAGTRLYPNVTLRENVRLGKHVTVHSNSVLGSDGFGYETVDGKHIKIPQNGSVEIGDDVEIGSCVCIDRGRFRNTLIGRGTKIDNLVQIAHNVTIGEDCLIVSQVGISGSARLEDRVIVAGQAGLVGHITIGHDAIIGARSGVSKSVGAGEVVLGEPARPIQEQKRLFALIARLPEFFKDFSEMKKRNP